MRLWTVAAIAGLSLAVAGCSSGSDSTSSSSAEPSGSASPSSSQAFPNNNADIDVSQEQLNFTVQALTDYAKPYVDVTIQGKKQNSYSQGMGQDASQYAKDQQQITTETWSCIQGELAKNPAKPALVLDIDETSLSNFWEFAREPNLAANPPQRAVSANTGQDPAIEATLELFNNARQSGMGVFFITGRNKSQEKITEQNLTAVGYKDWEKIYLTPNSGVTSVGEYKTNSRQDITNDGWTIVGNVGDQFSDIDSTPEGNPNEPCSYKLPNPYYFIGFN